MYPSLDEARFIVSAFSSPLLCRVPAGYRANCRGAATARPAAAVFAGSGSLTALLLTVTRPDELPAALKQHDKQVVIERTPANARLTQDFERLLRWQRWRDTNRFLLIGTLAVIVLAQVVAAPDDDASTAGPVADGRSRTAIDEHVGRAFDDRALASRRITLAGGRHSANRCVAAAAGITGGAAGSGRGRPPPARGPSRRRRTPVPP